MFQFIHTADIHLDSPLRGLEQYEGAPVDEIRTATRRALANLVDLALQREVDFVVIAGDLYDGDWRDHNTGLFFVLQMSRLCEASIPVVLISGNHDAANRMTKALRLPENVEWLSHSRAKTASSPRLRELGVAVHGRSFARAAEYGNLARDYPPRTNGMFNLGLLHTSLAGAEGHEPYAPCSLEELRQKQYDYWALGHVHQREVKCDDPPIVYCGNLQGRHIRETGPKGCYLVRVDSRGGVELEFQPLDVFRWDLCQVAAEDAQRPEDVLDRFQETLIERMEMHGDVPLGMRVQVTGRSRVHQQLAAEPLAWANQIRAAALASTGGRVWIEKVKLRTSDLGDQDQDAFADGPIAELRQYLHELKRDERQLAELAGELDDLRRKLPDDLLRGEGGLDFGDPDCLRQWLDDVQPLVIRRLVEGART
jgi:DNA repair protein SbcD/Mre11